VTALQKPAEIHYERYRARSAKLDHVTPGGGAPSDSLGPGLARPPADSGPIAAALRIVIAEIIESRNALPRWGLYRHWWRKT
jgi:hypothetical protein